MAISSASRLLSAVSLIGGVLIALTGAAPAQANRLDDDDIRERITGKRIYLAVPFGGEFPLFYRPDGRVDGTGEALGLGRFIRPTDSGRWWVKNDRLCQKWQTWYKGEVICFELSDAGPDKVRWVQDNGDTGVARIGK